MESQLSLRHEIDHNPKPEDARTFHIHVSVLGLGTSIDPTLSFVISYVCFEDIVFGGHSHQVTRLRYWLCSVGFTYQYACFACSELTELVFDLISSVSSRDCAVSVYMTSKVISLPLPPSPTDEEAIQASLDETTNDILSRPASKLAVGSLSRKLYKNNKETSNDSDASKCTICMEEFKTGQLVVTLPCKHEFDDCCIVEWYATRHDCPLCRFELPCEN